MKLKIGLKKKVRIKNYLIKQPKTRGSPSACAMRTGGGSRELDSERGIGVRGGIVMDVDFVRIGYGVLFSQNHKEEESGLWVNKK